MTVTNLYDTLGIEQNASAEDVRKAYRKKALETHPDKLEPNTCDREKQVALKHFLRVREAFETLSDPEKRKAYDANLVGRTDPALISAEARRRVEERRTWAQHHREKYEKRVAEIKARQERMKREMEAAAASRQKEATLVAEMLQEIDRLNPELTARRRAILQRKAERERAKNVMHTVLAPICSS